MTQCVRHPDLVALDLAWSCELGGQLPPAR
jgi:hypothetical protein